MKKRPTLWSLIRSAPVALVLSLVQAIFYLLQLSYLEPRSEYFPIFLINSFVIWSILTDIEIENSWKTMLVFTLTSTLLCLAVSYFLRFNLYFDTIFGAVTFLIGVRSAVSLHKKFNVSRISRIIIGFLPAIVWNYFYAPNSIVYGLAMCALGFFIQFRFGPKPQLVVETGEQLNS
jgi:hypothetical protein